MTDRTFIDRLLVEREALQEKHEALLLFLDEGATGASPMQRYLLSLQLCAMTNYGDILDRRLEDLDFPTGDFEPFCGPGLNNVGIDEPTTYDIRTTRVASEKEVGIDEAVEVGGHDIDRDGPIPFNG